MQGKRKFRFGVCGVIVVAALIMAGPVSAQTVQRDYPNPWNKEIGYAEVVTRGDTLYISGMTGEGATMAEQVRSVYAQIGALLTARGLDSTAILKENVYTRDIEAFKATGAVRKAFYKNETYPAATWVQVERLYNPEQIVEIEVTVALKQ